MISAIIVFLASVFIGAYTGQISYSFVPMFFYVLGRLSIWILSENRNKSVYARLYSISFMAFLIYAIMCYIYMLENSFSCLLVTDTITTYIPAVKDFMQLESLREGWELIYGSYSIHAYSHTGIILFYWAAVGKIWGAFGIDLYFSLQLSVLFLSSFVPVFLFRLLSQSKVKNPFLYSLIYVLCSVFFYYSSLILRDAPIALFYMIAFSYLLSEERIKRNVVFVLMILLSFLIRPQNGFFLLLFYFISFISNTEKKNTSIILLAIIGAIISYISIRLDILEALDRNVYYAEKNIAQSTEGIINALDRLPPVISDISKVLYIHISPIPSWLHLGFRGINESNNIMCFPRTFAVVYNFIILGGVLYGVVHYRSFHFGNKMTFIFLAALLYLMLQTSSTEQRRIMICYPIVFLFAILVYQNTPLERKNIIHLSLLAFALLQVWALI